MGIAGRIVVFLLGVGPTFQLALASPQGGPLRCYTPTTTSTTTFPVLQCLRQVCIPPISICSPGEPIGRTATPPRTTTVTSPNQCTALVEINRNGGCGLCATCLSANPGGPISVGTATAPASSSTIFVDPIVTERIIPTPPPYACETTTVSTTVSSPPHPCPLVRCLEGHSLSEQALPTTTVTDACTVSVVAGPGCQCPICV